MAMVFNATLDNTPVISWRSHLLVGETGISGGSHLPVASHYQTNNVVSSTLFHERDRKSQLLMVIDTEWKGSCKSKWYFKDIILKIVTAVIRSQPVLNSQTIIQISCDFL